MTTESPNANAPTTDPDRPAATPADRSAAARAATLDFVRERLDEALDTLAPAIADAEERRATLLRAARAATSDGHRAAWEFAKVDAVHARLELLAAQIEVARGLAASDAAPAPHFPTRGDG